MLSLQSAYILHQRPYRETSIIAEFFGEVSGRFVAIIKGAKRRKGAKALLQPFVPLVTAFRGKTELVNITHLELRQQPWRLKGINLLSGFYINELIIRMLKNLDAHPKLFIYYENVLAKLVDASPTCLQAALRVFEKNLLIEAGYGLNLSRDAKTGLVIDPNKTYIFEPELGFYTMQFIPPEQALQGTTLLALHEDTLHSAQALREAKIITRFALARYLSTKPLHSKALLQALIKRKSL